MNRPMGRENPEMWNKAVRCINEIRLVMCAGEIRRREGDAMWQDGMQALLDRVFKMGRSLGREELEPMMRRSFEFLSDNPQLAAERTGVTVEQAEADLIPLTLALENLDEAIEEANHTITPIDPGWMANVGIMPPSRFQ